MKDLKVKNNEELNRFEADLDGERAHIAYRKESDGRTLKLWHTEVPEKYQGKGVGSELVKKTLEQIKTAGKKVIPSCPFVSDYIERHPEYESLVK